MGGPIVKNKAFFFYDQELLKQRQEVFAQAAVPTAAMWGGDFSNITDTSGDKFTLYNPYTTTANGARAPFPNNVIPASLLNQQVLNGFKSVTPLPNGPNATANPWIGYNYQTYYPQNTNTNSITGRFDQIFSERNNFSVRFTKSTYDYLQTGGQYGFPPPGQSNSTGSAARKSDVYNITAHYTHVFNPSLLNDLQLGAVRSKNSQGTGADSVNWDAKLGLPNPFGATGWPTVYTDAYNMFYGGGWDSDNHKAQNMTQYEIDDNVTWVKGKHSVRFGFKGRQEYNNVEELQQAQGSDSFSSAWTGLYKASAQAITPFTGSGLASLELGLPSYLSNQYNRGFFYFKQKEVGLFAEDSWKITPKLTLSYGLRWEFWTPYKEKYNRMDTIDLNSLSPTSMQVVLPEYTTLNTIPGLPPPVTSAWAARGLTGVSANSIGFPSALTPSVWTDFAPHVCPSVPAYQQVGGSRRLWHVLLAPSAIADPAIHARQSAAEPAVSEQRRHITRSKRQLFAHECSESQRYAGHDRHGDSCPGRRRQFRAGFPRVGRPPLERQSHAGVDVHDRARARLQPDSEALLYRQSRQQSAAELGSERSALEI